MRYQLYYLQRQTGQESRESCQNDNSLNDVVVKEIKVVGSRCGPFKPVLDLMEKNLIQLDKYISATFPLSNASDAFAKAKDKDSLKVQLLID